MLPGVGETGIELGQFLVQETERIGGAFQAGARPWKLTRLAGRWPDHATRATPSGSSACGSQTLAFPQQLPEK